MLLPRRSKPGSVCPRFREAKRDVIQKYPKECWQDLIPKAVDLATFVPRYNNQLSVGQCGCESGIQKYEITKRTRGDIAILNARGEKCWDVDLSPASVYCRREVNGGRDRGSHLDDVIRELMTRGALPTLGQGFAHECQAVGWRESILPSGWEETAALFRIDPDECYEIEDHEEAVAAWLDGYCTSSGRDSHAMVEVQYYYDDQMRLWRKDLGSWGMGEVGRDYKDGYHRNLVNPHDDHFYTDYGAWAARAVIIPSQAA